MESGSSKEYVYDRIQGLWTKLSREQLKSKVTSNWRRLFSSASNRLIFDRKPTTDDRKADGGYGARADGRIDAEWSGDVPEWAEEQQENMLDNVVKTEKTMECEKSDVQLLSPVVEAVVEPPRNKSPVQQWVDSLPIDDHRPNDDENSRAEEEMTPINDPDNNDAEVESLTLGAEAPGVVFPRPFPFVQVTNACESSDAGSHCSSMESLLEARRPDPEELLLELGFGGSEEPDTISRIPERFLRPSAMKGVAIDDFIKHQQMMVHTFQSGFSGYRGLTGPSHAMPSGIVGKIMDRLREAEMERANQEALHGPNPHHHHHYHHNRNPLLRHHHHSHPGSHNNSLSSPPPLPPSSLAQTPPPIPLPPPPPSVDRPQQHCAAAQTQTGYSPKLARLAHNLMVKMKGVKEVSVLSPENRNWYQSQGDKSPETAGRRIIIGHHSYTFAKDGNLIEDMDYEKKESSSESAVSRSEPDEWINSTVSDIKLIINDGHGEITERGSDDDSGVENSGGGLVETEDNGMDPKETVEAEKEDEKCEDVVVSPSGSSSSQALPSPSSSLSSAASNLSSQYDKETLQVEFNCMLRLVSQLNVSENPIDLGSEDNFYALSPDERKRLQVCVIESALATYQKRLKELDLRSHLRELLDGRLHRVTDLLDDTKSPSVVTIIKQMTSLLRHQESLRQELSMHEPPGT